MRFLKGGKRNFSFKGTRDGAEEARVAHNHEVAGSKPASAIYLGSAHGPMDKAPAYGAGDSGFESQWA